jgi:hypothetical protein
MLDGMLRRALVATGALALLAAACERAPDRPVARLAVEPAEVSLPYPGVAVFELAWEPTAPLGEVEGELRVFVHLLDEDEEIARTFDHRYPHAWEVARPVRHRLELYQSLLGPPLAASDYALTAGLYDASGRRWALATTGEEVGRREYRIGTVRVESAEASAAVPAVDFASGWLPLEPGGDRQILGRRWTTGAEAALALGGGEGGELALWLTIPEPPTGVERRLAEGAREPAVRVTADCDGSSHHLAGVGSHEIAVAVPAGGDCRVTLAPTFELAWPDGPARSVYLENLYWRSTGG